MAVYNLFDGVPQLAADPDTDAVNLGTEFYVTAPAWVTQVRFLQPITGGNASVRQAAIYSTTNGTTGTLVAGPFTMPAPVAGQWCTLDVAPLALTPGTRYRVVIRHPTGKYPATASYFNPGGPGYDGRTTGPVIRPGTPTALAGHQGSYGYAGGIGFTGASFGGASYYSDATITDADPTVNTGPVYTVALPDGTERPATMQGVLMPDGTVRDVDLDVAGL